MYQDSRGEQGMGWGAIMLLTYFTYLLIVRTYFITLLIHLTYLLTLLALLTYGLTTSWPGVIPL